MAELEMPLLEWHDLESGGTGNSHFSNHARGFADACTLRSEILCLNGMIWKVAELE